jgi:SAM-dependent methyltransferase
MGEPYTPQAEPRASFFRRNLGPIVMSTVVLVAWAVAMVELFERRPPDVGYVATPPEVVNAMVDLAAVKDGDHVYDLGCGDGRLVIAAAERGPNVTGAGIDIDPDLVAEARDAAVNAGLGNRITFRRADLFREDLRNADVVMMFLTTSVNQKLLPQLEQTKHGTRIVSHSYSIPGVKPTKEIRVRASDGSEHRILLWVTPFVKE